MLSIQQLIKTLKKIQNNSNVTSTSGDLLKTIKHVTNIKEIAISTTTDITNVQTSSTTSLRCSSNSGSSKEFANKTSNAIQTTSSITEQTVQAKVDDNQSCSDSDSSCSLYGGFESTSCSNNNSSQQAKQQTPLKYHFSLYSHLNVEGSKNICDSVENSTTQDSSKVAAEISTSSSPCVERKKTYSSISSELHQYHQFNNKQPQQQQRIHNFVEQKIFNQFKQFHTQHNQHLNTKQKQTQFAMSSLAAEPLTAPILQQKDDHNPQAASSSDDESSRSPPASKPPKSTTGKPCFSSGLGDIIQFMELIGNLKHTKRTGWLLRDIDDCESISGHMYRMSILTFLLDGTEGLNQIRCMELALVHDLAESLVGDITPFCGVAKEEKKAMELKAMEDICKLIEPRGKRIMELFEEYESAQSPESRFVKDLDRLDMVMQAFEYEKRDNCLLKHQEFFDSTEGKFNHPFVKKLVGEIYEQREKLAKAKGATPPPKVDVPNMDDPTTYASKTTNGHHDECTTVKSSLEENTETKKIS